MTIRPLALAALALAATATTQAAPYKALPGSTLGFSASYQGDAFEGSFSKFTPRVDFDPGNATGSFDVAIDLASVGTKNDERDEALRGEDFFNTRKSSQARYSATKFRALGGNKFAADGTLSLNGISKPVVLQFTFTPGSQAVLAGSARVKRLDFKVGTGDWSDTGDLPDEVKVKTRLLLAPLTPPGTPAPKKP
jgi:polyisoprenoid-binding protein YceI